MGNVNAHIDEEGDRETIKESFHGSIRMLNELRSSVDFLFILPTVKKNRFSFHSF